jgi:hypothetical protein
MFSSHPSPVAEVPSLAPLRSLCPYRNAKNIYCSASIVRAAISKRQNEAYCSTENFDCCPMFLGKVLRGA